MIRYLRGDIIEKSRQRIVLDIQGVGYDVVVTPSVLAQATIGEQGEFFVSESIREDAHDLYGFRQRGERDMFELLRKVSGVGPKVAIALIGFYQPAELGAIIMSKDIAKLSLVPGIGKKVAEKIVVELQDKTSGAVETPLTDPDTVAVLQSLGYSPAEIAKVVTKIPASLTTTQDKITWVLRTIGE